jgi:hypothetical protein
MMKQIIKIQIKLFMNKENFQLKILELKLINKWNNLRLKNNNKVNKNKDKRIS